MCCICAVSAKLKLFLTDPSLYPTNLPAYETLRLQEDGWIVGPNGELILWLPLGLRNGEELSDRRAIDQIDFNRLKYGTEWTQCRLTADL